MVVMAWRLLSLPFGESSQQSSSGHLKKLQTYALDEDPTFGRTNFIIELPQEIEPDQTLDTPALWQVLDVNSEIALPIPRLSNRSMRIR